MARFQSGATSWAVRDSGNANDQVSFADGTGAATFRATTTATGVLINAAAIAAGAGVVRLGNAVQTTVGAAGGATAQPLTPLGYLLAYIGTQQIAIPYHLPA